jgi:hypothetical protein
VNPNLPRRKANDKRSFKVKAFVHKLFGLPPRLGGLTVVRNDDEVFAIQERLCSIIEIEIEGDDGIVRRGFASKINRLLKERETR